MTLSDISRTVVEAAIKACWKQWKQLGALASGPPGDSQSVIDPEALLLLSFHMDEHERRLQDMWLWWASTGSRLTSVQRLLTLAGTFPESSRARISAFAAAAYEAGDKRWKRHAETEAAAERRRGPKGRESPNLWAPGAILVRLRAGVGLGAKADMLAFLLSNVRGAPTISEVAASTAYSKQAIRQAANDLVLARFISESSDGPARLKVPLEAWYHLLASPHQDDWQPPRWCYWSDLFATLAAISEWSGKTASASSYVLSSKARDLVTEHMRGLEMNEIHIEHPEAFAGDEYLPAFARSVDVIARWIVQRA